MSSSVALARSPSKSMPPTYESVAVRECDACVEERLDCTCQPDYQSDQQAEEDDEVTRLSKFIFYCLCVDYNCDLKVTPSAADLETYLTYQDYIRGIMLKEPKSSGQHVCHTVSDKWLARHIIDPSDELGIDDWFAQIIHIHYVLLQSGGTYTSCLESVLARKGIAHLAEKMWIDLNVILPRLEIASKYTEQLRSSIAMCATKWFVRLDGVICGCRHDGSPAYDSAGELAEPLSYALTAQGKSCQATIRMDPRTRYMYDDDDSLPSLMLRARSWLGRLHARLWKPAERRLHLW